MRLFIAGSSKDRKEIKEYAERLKSNWPAFKVEYFDWMDAAAWKSSDQSPAFKRTVVDDDNIGLEWADAFVFYLTQNASTGAGVELGRAIGFGMPIAIVPDKASSDTTDLLYPYPNSFYEHQFRVFPKDKPFLLLHYLERCLDRRQRR